MSSAAPLSSPHSAAAAAGVPTVAVAHGDGIGPEIMEATLAVLDASQAGLDWKPVHVGERVYNEGHASGISPETWEVVRSCDALLKAPITTPQGGGVKSLNVTLRKSLGLYANVRPCRAYAPFVPTLHPQTDIVVVRENEEDLYAGIEHRQTEDVVQCLKLMTRSGCERIARYAFEYAQSNGRSKVTCLTKDNIMKLTDGLFHRVFEEVASEYPEIQAEHMIVDIGMARVATRPERFDVVLAPNLYGDIVSDVVAEVAGSVGLAPSANIGERHAMFEAVHGSAPDIAGKGVANPSGLLLASVMMLVHLGLAEQAELVHNAWLCTLEDGVHTADISGPETKVVVGTQAFASAVADRLGRKPSMMAQAAYVGRSPLRVEPVRPRAPGNKETVGVDVFVEWRQDVGSLVGLLEKAGTDKLKIQLVTNRGVKMWPGGLPETLTTDHWRCRFMAEAGVAGGDIVALQARVVEAGLEVVKTENLCVFDGVPGFSLGQGQ
jgi:isocitrate dehydrogenase